MNDASDAIKGYRSVIKKDFDILEKKLDNIIEGFLEFENARGNYLLSIDLYLEL